MSSIVIHILALMLQKDLEKWKHINIITSRPMTISER